METITKKRRGRAREAVSISVIADEAESTDNDDNGNGAACGTGDNPQIENAASQRVSLPQLRDIVLRQNSAHNRIMRFTHPDADYVVIEHPEWGGIVQDNGECGYYLNTGEFVRI